MDQQLRNVQLVTERYRDLQGLRVAIAGAMLAAVCGVMLLAAPQASQRMVLRTIIVTFLAMFPLQWALDRYYEARFGRIVVGPVSRIAGLWLIAAMILTGIVTGSAFGPAQIAVTFAIAAAAALFIAIRDWPRRGYHLVGAAATAYGAAIQFAALSSPTLPRTQLIAFLVLGLTYVPIGLLDHRLLASVMRAQPDEAGLKACATGAVDPSHPTHP